MQGEQLYERLESTKMFDEQSARKYFRQILDAINYIHKNGVSHRDIKPENFMFEDKQSDNLKLIDFGLSSTFIPRIDQENSKTKHQLINMKTLVGTSYYIAPEVYSSKYTEKCDIWSAGNYLFNTIIINLIIQ